jgi:hypothetical protein
LCGLGLGSACTIKDHPDIDNPAPAGSGGSDATAGKTNSGGKAGSSTSTGGKGGRPSVPRGGEGGGGEGGDGGEGGATQCPGCSSGFCLEDGTCVDCLPSNDQCEAGQYCTAEYVCEPGCKPDGSSCASGICNEEHNCENCIADAECLPTLVCSAGRCSARCTGDAQGQSAACGDLLCCDEHCTDVLTDSQNCGGCGMDCAGGQFCGLTTCGNGSAPECSACFDTALSGLCNIGKVIVILDSDKNEQEGNRIEGRAIGAALHDVCPFAPEVIEAEQASVEALNLTSGQPVSGGGELLVVAGGPFYQNLQGYLEERRIAPLYLALKETPEAATEFRRSSDDEVVLTLPVEGDHDAHDYFIIQFMRDGASGSLALNAQGMWLSGTVAATYQLKNVILPDLGSFTKAWYAYEWEDLDDDLAPDLNEIVEVGSGN